MRLITEIHRAVHAIDLKIAEVGDITQAEALVLAILAPRETMRLEDIHKAFLHRRSTLTNVLARLEKRKLLRRRVAEQDRRRFDLQLTETGKKRASQVQALFHRIIADSGLSASELSSAGQALSKVVRASHNADADTDRAP